jgi:hypothetical protein
MTQTLYAHMNERKKIIIKERIIKKKEIASINFLFFQILVYFYFKINKI